MKRETETEMFQIILGFGALVPTLTGFSCLLAGLPGRFGVEHPNFDNQYIFLSAILMAIGIGFLTCIKRIERRGARLRALGYVYMFGGVMRFLFVLGVSGPWLYASLAVETLGMGAMLYWHRRLERLYGFRK